MDVSVPLNVPCDPATADAEVLANDRLKSAIAVTVNDRVCVFAAGAPLVFAEMVTVDVPVGVPLVVPIVSVTGTGVLDVGFTDAEGEKLQVAPVGRPLHESETVPANDPEAVTEKLMFCEVFGRFTVTVPG